MVTKFPFAHKIAVVKNRPIILCGHLTKGTSCMLRYCVSCEDLLKKKHYSTGSSCKILVVLSTNIVNKRDGAVGIKYKIIFEVHYNKKWPI